jgi:orotidine-5'-phosphate decarboxylase
MPTFVEKLDSAAQRNHSLLCVGLDPTHAQMPIDDTAAFCISIIDATKDLVCGFKPNIAFFEAQGLPGLHALEQTMAAIPSDVPVILDAKRGDIGSTAVAYAHAAFEQWGADAVTTSPYLGRDSIEPFLAYKDRGVFILCRTSNPGGADFQSLQLATEGGAISLYEHVAMQAQSWNINGNIGLVVGATAPEELARVRALCPDMPILIPGVGVQGGDVEVAVRNGTDANGRRAIISSSRQVIYASKSADFAEAARREALKARDAFNAMLEAMGKGW